MNRDESAQQLYPDLIEAVLYHFITKNKYYFDVYTFIGQQIKICQRRNVYTAKENRAFLISQEFLLLTLWM